MVYTNEDLERMKISLGITDEEVSSENSESRNDGKYKYNRIKAELISMRGVLELDRAVDIRYKLENQSFGSIYSDIIEDCKGPDMKGKTVYDMYKNWKHKTFSVGDKEVGENDSVKPYLKISQWTDPKGKVREFPTLEFKIYFT